MTNQVQSFEFFATCLPGAERLLADELHGLGVKKVRPLSGGASFFGAPEDALRVCLWSRLAGRVNLTVGRVAARDADALYAGVRELPWETVIADGASIAVRASGTNAELRNTQFVALKVKDAICDRLAETRGARPDVKPQQPDALVEVRLREEKASLSLDLSGRSLTRRAYLGDEAGEEAPSVVSQAATLLAAVGAAELFAEGTTFLDPVDGGSILAREAAEVREDRAPGLLRERWGFTGWTAFPDKAWGDLLDEADERCEARMALLATAPACPDAPRLVASVASVFRADDDAEAVAVRAACVAASREAPAGSRFAFAGFEGMAAKFKEEPTVRLKLGRGRSETTVEVFDRPPRRPSVISVANPAGGADIPVEVNDPAAAQFASRLRKVARERRKWAAREGVACYRLYDADVPEYACAIDLYEGAAEAEGELYAHVAEYAPPKSVDPEQAHARFEDVLALVPVVLGIPPEHVFSKSRLRAKGGEQYRDAGGRRFVTHTSEDGLICEIDLGGYLDTGIFLDHRVTREMVGKMAAGKRFLNLFAYTGVATLHAAAGGAKETTTVDLSQTYLDWAARNLAANGFAFEVVDKPNRRDRTDGGSARGRRGGAANKLVRADVTRWIAEARRRHERYDLIFVDPPTFSNSKAMGRRTWDVQRDHVELLVGVSRLLSNGGAAVFSCNLRTFKPDLEELARCGVELEDITAQTIPHDFERNPRIHKCYLVRRK